MFHNGLEPKPREEKEEINVRKTTGSCRLLVTLTIFGRTTVQNYTTSF